MVKYRNPPESAMYSRRITKDSNRITKLEIGKFLQRASLFCFFFLLIWLYSLVSSVIPRQTQERQGICSCHPYIGGQSMRYTFQLNSFPVHIKVLEPFPESVYCSKHEPQDSMFSASSPLYAVVAPQHEIRVRLLYKGHVLCDCRSKSSSLSCEMLSYVVSVLKAEMTCVIVCTSIIILLF